ncbi:MAG: DUF1576 domain-containing protein, partial [Spirochaetaceae bacterium]
RRTKPAHQILPKPVTRVTMESLETPRRSPDLIRTETGLYRLTWVILLAIIAVGFLVQGPARTAVGLWELQLHPARLINDFTAVAGTGATMVNAALVAAIGLSLLKINRIRISGPAIAAVYTMLGFGLFGKTPVNVLPIIVGVFVAARIAGKKFDQYILIALFGTALAPVVSTIAVEVVGASAYSWPAAVAAGIALGILLPAAAMVMLRLHQGYNLYNIGLTSGFLALFASSVLLAGGATLEGTLIWNDRPDIVLRLFVPVISAVLVWAGLVDGSRTAIVDLRRILKLSGRLPSDFMDLVSPHGSLLNMGLLGFASWLYVLAVGAPLNGPVLGGIFTVVGFGAFGKHLKNCLPVVVGVLAATLVFRVDPTAPGAILALLFGTTLAPLAGEFGPTLGFVAGVLHFTIVMRSGAWHAGIALYNNGFAGGLTATLLAAVTEWYHQSDRGSPTKERE